MNATLSTRQIRLVALLVGIVILAAGYLVVSRPKSTTPSAARSTPASTTPAATTPTHSTPTQSRPASKAHAHAVTPVKLDTYGMPIPVARALEKHSIVVVSLGSPRGAVDQLAAGEAQAAAASMRAGYVYIDVYHQQPGTALLRKLGLFSTPATLVVKRGGNVYSNFKGFVDRDVVEQAISDAHS